ncbi:MAG TPA: hypothetical protein DD491_17445 [Halieaceae bacterium]|nr:hypothetical protein [Halieaceae bacterium]
MPLKRLLRHRLLRAVLALCLLGRLGVPVLGFAQPCTMPGTGDHAGVMDAHGAMSVDAVAAGATVAMDGVDCCQDDGPCQMAHCMVPPAACGAQPLLAPPPGFVTGPASPRLSPRALPQRHFRPPIAA